jgi:GMP synthase PP-ATPase subunit
MKLRLVEPLRTFQDEVRLLGKSGVPEEMIWRQLFPAGPGHPDHGELTGESAACPSCASAM